MAVFRGCEKEEWRTVFLMGIGSVLQKAKEFWRMTDTINVLNANELQLKYG